MIESINFAYLEQVNSLLFLQIFSFVKPTKDQFQVHSQRKLEGPEMESKQMN